MMMEVTIKGTAYTVKPSLRALFLYERLSGNNGFEVHTSEDNFMLLYASIAANNKECALTYDDFIDACEDDPTIITALTAGMADMAGEIAAKGNAAKTADSAKKKSALKK